MNEVQKQKRTAYIVQTEEIPTTTAASFDYVAKELSRVCQSIASGHEYFRVAGGGPLKLGAVICLVRLRARTRQPLRRRNGRTTSSYHQDRLNLLI